VGLLPVVVVFYVLAPLLCGYMIGAPAGYIAWGVVAVAMTVSQAATDLTFVMHTAGLGVLGFLLVGLGRASRHGGSSAR
jgi:hypothetical protein